MFLPSVALVAALTTSDLSVIDAVTSHWQATARDLKTLHVECEVTVTETKLKREQTCQLSLRLLRTTDGLVGMMDVRQDGQLAERYLLRDGTITLIDPKQKVKRILCPTDMTQFVIDYLHPFLVVIDPERLKKTYSVEVEKRDDYFTFLQFTPLDKKSDQPAGRLVVVHHKNTDLPVGAPRVILYDQLDVTIRHDITRWEVNGEGPAEPQRFEWPGGRAVIDGFMGAIRW